MNPDRRCWWGGDHTVNVREIVAALRQPGVEALDQESIAWVHDEVASASHDGLSCPACMLACLRQSGLDYHVTGWSYGVEVEEYRKAERDLIREGDYGY